MQNQINNAFDTSIAKTKAITIIGGGNMGISLLGGLIAQQFNPHRIIVTGLDPLKLKEISEKFAVQTSTDNLSAAAQADIVIFAIKPQVFSEVALELTNTIQQKKPLIISVATGITAARMQQWLGGGLSIIRSMPNTPVVIGCGATGLYANDFVTTEQKQWADAILSAVGMTLWVPREELIDVVTALSGSGPAYFFLIMEALQNAGEKLGLTSDDARALTLQTAYGAAKLAIESKKDLAELRKAVTSPGGTTEQAIKVLEKAPIREIMAEALNAAYRRAKELSQ